MGRYPVGVRILLGLPAAVVGQWPALLAAWMLCWLLICAFQSPMFQSPVAGELVQSLRALSEQSSRTASLLQLHETPFQENCAQIAERTFLLLYKRNHFCPQISPHSERHPNLPFAHQRFGLW